MVKEEGERIYVTDRDEIIAEIHKPTTPLIHRISRWETFLNEQELSGALIRAKRKESTVLKDLQKEPSWPDDLDNRLIEEEIRRDRF